VRFPLRAPRVGPVSWLFQSSVVSRSNATRGPRPRVEVLRLSVRASEPGATSFLSLPCQRAPAYQGLRANPRVPSHPIPSHPTPPRTHPHGPNHSISQSLNLSISQSLNRSIPRTCAFARELGTATATPASRPTPVPFLTMIRIKRSLLRAVALRTRPLGLGLPGVPNLPPRRCEGLERTCAPASPPS
jgi:hypothetical protein